VTSSFVIGRKGAILCRFGNTGGFLTCTRKNRTMSVKPYDDKVPRYGELIFRRLLHTLRNNTNVLTLAGSMVAYVNNNLVFSNANLFSNPMSHAIPNGRPGDGLRVSLMIGILALGNGLTSKLVSRSRRSPIIATKSEACKAASLLSIKQTRSISEFLSPNELQLLPKLNNLELGSMVFISLSMRTLTSSFVASSSVVGNNGRTKEKSEVDRSVKYWRNRRVD